MTSNHKKITKALILAAGRGLRMGGIANQLPKCLLSLGDETILHFQLRALRWALIKEVAIVTGYRSESVHQGAKGFKVKFIHNPEYNTTNSLYSFYCAREFVADGALVLNSDVVFHPELLKRLIDEPHPDALLYEPRQNMGDEEMKIAVDDANIVTRVSKLISQNEAAGENLGIVKFGPGTAKEAFSILLEHHSERLSKLWLPECINMLQGLRQFRAVSIGSMPWTEIDFAEDLEFARNNVYRECAPVLLT